tara:strand:+ start:1619 stop:2029 length:411 start_codon:yes stop_codon:yes gene_type:complete
MQLNIEPLKPSDYDDYLRHWWKDWRWPAPTKEFLPLNGTGGFMVSYGDRPICAGFMYTTNAQVAWCDWIISDFHFKDKKVRKTALLLLIKTITLFAESLDNKYVYALIKNQSLANAYKSIGYVEGSSYTHEMIKIL